MTTGFLKENANFPFCKGCGHHHYVKHLDDAFAQLRLDPQHVCIVSDIGCIGVLDSLFSTPHTFHTTHGRSTAFATGIELADGILHDSKLKTVVVIGDGGATIGLLHIVNAALMNVDVTVLVANNMLYGMTGGQNSGFSPLNFVTPTTPNGNIVPPMDLCGVVKSCGAEHITRISATDKNLTSVIASAIEHPGFALVEIMELCTEFAVGKNNLTGKSLQQMADTGNSTGQDPGGSFKRTEFSELYKKTNLAVPAAVKDDSIQRLFAATLHGKQQWVLAGTAGEKVQLASYLLMRAGVSCGLHATQKNDNPVTQGSGFSLSEVCLSDEPINYTGIDRPDIVIITSADGLKEVALNGTLERCGDASVVIADDSLPSFETNGRIVRVPLRSLCTPNRAALCAVAALVAAKNILPAESITGEITRRFKDKASPYLSAIEKILSFMEQVPEQAS